MRDSSPSVTDASQSKGFALVALPDGALLLEIASGTVYSLNRTAALIWEAYLGGEGDDLIAINIAAQYDLAPEIALKDVKAALCLPSEYTTRAPSDFRYERLSDRYLFSYKGEATFEIEQHGRTLHAGDLIRRRPAMAPQLLQAVLPKILALRGHLVLHASAVRVGKAIIAFTGSSGAGKTTTARALVEAGASPVSEDKLVLKLDESGNVLVLLDGERALLRWIDEIASDLAAGRGVGCAPVDELVEGSSMRLLQLGVLEESRRHEGSLAIRQMSSSEAASVVFNNSFLGSDQPSTWIAQLKSSARVAAQVAVSEMAMPQGLAGLRLAARELLSVDPFRGDGLADQT
jgi:hypothetical protein